MQDESPAPEACELRVNSGYCTGFQVLGKRSRCSTEPVDLAEPGNDLVPPGGHWGRHRLCITGTFWPCSSTSAAGTQISKATAVRSSEWGRDAVSRISGISVDDLKPEFKAPVCAAASAGPLWIK